ncbi:DUF3570 domain-containing protein [Colwellia psychrerythraea]|uniref:DUF3570 domain-containing protein n=1 Tax=Colwellia psychrerythraea (strain 34H / ATCC BAA-681) TaxID=167879 RepID=Q480L9_COLP3|nr:DUF3570 domain-containing protein [Colwellia psychrerythraea]AAZ26976.1 hypothetical protein CPS_2788 [Colwellia psychrerythraea 34H]
MNKLNETSKKTNKKPNIKAALSLATSALLGTGVLSAGVAQATEADEWQFDSAFLIYSEADRVSATEAIIAGTKTFANDEILSLKLTIDALTGASANGAVAQPNAQTFTRPSGNGQYVTPAGETPLDDTFHDTRVQLNAQWTQPLSDNITGSVGGHFSKEYDYLSLGVNGNLAYDFNKKNTTVSMGLSYFQDTFTPEGGIPKPHSSMLVGDSSSPEWDAEFAKTRIGDSDDKSTADILVGVTQVINRRMITAFNYSYSMVDGYLTDPFKVVSVLNTDGLAQDYIYESRPDSRVKQSTFMQAKYNFDDSLLNTVADVSYRYMWDDWGINSHTIDTRFTIPVGATSYIEPHIRFYQQSEADFYQPYVIDEQAPIGFVSADYRIGEMTAITVGAKYGVVLNGGNELSFRLEYYRQTPTNAGFTDPNALSGQDIYPVVEAIIAQVSYSF